MKNPDLHVGDTVFYLDALVNAIIETGIEGIRYEMNSPNQSPPWKTMVKLEGKWFYLCFVYVSWDEAYANLKRRMEG